MQIALLSFLGFLMPESRLNIVNKYPDYLCLVDNSTSAIYANNLANCNVSSVLVRTKDVTYTAEKALNVIESDRFKAIGEKSAGAINCENYIAYQVSHSIIPQLTVPVRELLEQMTQPPHSPVQTTKPYFTGMCLLNMKTI